MTTITTLAGLPSDYTFRGGVAMHRNGQPTAFGGYDEIRFSAATFRIVNDKPVPTFAMPAASGFTQADLDKARADGRAEGIAAVRAALAGVR